MCGNPTAGHCEAVLREAQFVSWKIEMRWGDATADVPNP
jgi:hypothetical protein